jgi:hypothetical protein
MRPQREISWINALHTSLELLCTLSNAPPYIQLQSSHSVYINVGNDNVTSAVGCLTSARGGLEGNTAVGGEKLWLDCSLLGYNTTQYDDHQHIRKTYCVHLHVEVNSTLRIKIVYPSKKLVPMYETTWYIMWKIILPKKMLWCTLSWRGPASFGRGWCSDWGPYSLELQASLYSKQNFCHLQAQIWQLGRLPS